MKVLIAHRNASYIEAIEQILRASKGDIASEGVTSVDELGKKVAHNNFDVLLVDGELDVEDPQSLLDVLSQYSSRYPIILTVPEDAKELAEKAQELGVFDCVLKKKGYLSLLPESVERAATMEKQRIYEKSEKHDQNGGMGSRVSDEATSGIGYFICDRKGRFLSANKYVETLTGYTEEELLELSLTDLISKEEEETFFKRIFEEDQQEPTIKFNFNLIDKLGEKHPAEIRIRVLRDESGRGHIIGFRGNVVVTEESQALSIERVKVDQNRMIDELIQIFQLSYSEPLNVVLNRVAEVICQVFGFRRSTVALLDRRKHVFVKQAMVGYLNGQEDSIEKRAIEVPQEVIERIFADRFKIKVIYHTQDQRGARDYLSPGMPERRTQKRRPESQWHKRDLILINLTDHNDNTFGYISLDEPEEGQTPTRSTFYNLEIFGKLTSLAIENFYRISTLERRNRRLKQILVTSNIFKLYLSLSELLKEFVWSVKFSLNFNLVSLVLISKNTGLLETKAVACDDKIKLLQLKELRFELNEFGKLLKDEYRRNRSYFISEEEPILRHMKRIYYGAEHNGRYGDGWPNWALLLVPIKSREGKIIGFLMADDPEDLRIPNPETIHILEIMANQIAIAIDNRVMYVQAKEQSLMHEPEPMMEQPMPEIDDTARFFDEREDDFTKGGFKKLVERFLR